MLIDQIIALIVFIATILLITTERIHRDVVVIAAATVLMATGVISIDEAIKFVDFQTLLLLAGMMIIIEILRELGFFQFVAIKIAKRSGNYKAFFILMCLSTGLLSSFISSVTVILIFSSITITILKVLKKDPKPLLLSQVLCSNIGGNATLIGEPTNIMVAIHKNFTFLDFIYILMPITIVCLLICIILFMRSIKEEEGDILPLVADLDEYAFIKDKRSFNLAIILFILTILLFFIQSVIPVSPAVIALIGATLMLLAIKVDVRELLYRIDWETLIFIAGLFIIVGGLIKTGIISFLAGSIFNLNLKGLPLIIIIGILTAFGSAAIANVPFVALMIPIIDKLSINYTSNILWWIMLTGANLGGNLTPIGSAPNIVAIAISEREGNPITFKEFIEICGPVALITLGISFLMLIAFHIFKIV